jgi:SAM-dependent methyltransferase
LPEDKKERDRLDFQHQLFALTFDNKLVIAPITGDLHNVLDAGTGTGVWAIEFADEHPESSVVGVDLSAIQPTSTPPNCKFEVDDLEDPWTYPQKFDLIHARMMQGSIAHWPKFLEQAFAATKPGGWIELQDATFPPRCDDDSMPDTCALSRWSDMMIEAGQKSGRGVNAAQQYKQWLEEAGYVDCVEIIYKWPMNPWPKDETAKELGKWSLINMLDGVHGFTVALFTRVLGKTLEETETFLVDVKKDVEDKKIHSYWPM